MLQPQKWLGFEAKKSKNGLAMCLPVRFSLPLFSFEFRELSHQGRLHPIYRFSGPGVNFLYLYFIYALTTSWRGNLLT